MSLFVWTLLPLAAMHLLLYRRHPSVFRFQLLLDLIVLVVLGPALWIVGDLNPVRCLQEVRPFSHVAWSQETGFQPTQSDLTFQFHPWWEETGRQINSGKLPLIQPGAGGGLPLMANGQTGLWAPVMLPVWLHGPERGTTIMAFWKIELAGLGAFLLMMGCRVRWVAAAVAGVAWAGVPYLIGWLLVPLAWVGALLPWTWMMVLWSLKRPASSVVVIGLFFGWLMGSGLHPETGAIVCGSALLMLLVHQPLRWRRVIAIVAVAGLTAVLLSWPTVGMIRASSRHDLVAQAGSNRERLPWSIQKDLACQIIVPASMGHPGRGDWKPEYPHAPGAAGVGGMVLGLLAVGAISGRFRRLAWSAGLTSAIGVILLVRVPPLDALLVRIPPLDQMTLPRFGILIPWGLVVLAALSLDGALRGRIRPLAARLVPAGVVGVVALVAAPWHLQPASIALVVLSVAGTLGVALFQRRAVVPLLVAGEAALLAIGINPVANPTDRMPRPALIERLQVLNHEEPGCIIGLGRVLPPNLAMRYGLRDLRASDPLRPRSFARLMGVLGEPKTILGGALHNAPPGLCGAWGVRYALTRPRKNLEGWDEVYSDADGMIWSNPQVLPEVRLVGSVTVEPGEAPDLLKVIDGFDFEHTALVSDPAPPVLATKTVLEMGLRTPTGLEATVECNGPCLLVLAQPWAPGWRAKVDGATAKVVVTNIAGMGVAAPEGRHRVTLSYHPWAW